ncbi:MAG: polysaccharide deacetylase family protein [Ilumatobacteraceae bacterium]
MEVVELLGFAAGTTVAVVHADDIGMSHAANVGAFAALDAGPVTCGSVMVPCPWFSEAAEMAPARSDVDLGVHLTLNSEFDGLRWGPVAGRSAVPSLVDETGHLSATGRETVKYASVEDVRAELRAQVDAALAAGIDVTHLDSHMGTVFHPKFFEIYLDLGREHQLPLFLPGGVETLGPLPEDFIVFDGFDADSLGFAEGDGEPHNERRIDELEPGLNYLICHPAQGGDELSAITDTAHQRDFERRFYGGEGGRSKLAAAGVETVGMRELRDLLRRRASTRRSSTG